MFLRMLQYLFRYHLPALMAIKVLLKITGSCEAALKPFRVRCYLSRFVCFFCLIIQVIRRRYPRHEELESGEGIPTLKLFADCLVEGCRCKPSTKYRSMVHRRQHNEFSLREAGLGC